MRPAATGTAPPQGGRGPLSALRRHPLPQPSPGQRTMPRPGPGGALPVRRFQLLSYRGPQAQRRCRPGRAPGCRACDAQGRHEHRGRPGAGNRLPGPAGPDAGHDLSAAAGALPAPPTLCQSGFPGPRHDPALVHGGSLRARHPGLPRQARAPGHGGCGCGPMVLRRSDDPHGGRCLVLRLPRSVGPAGVELMKKPVTAGGLGLAACHGCGLLSRPGSHHHARCPRCGTPLHLRKPDSIARTWALIIAAAILYIPANLLPIMETSSLFGAQADTIMSGVVYLWTSGSWPLALVVFIASVLVPLAKLFSLVILVVSVQRRSHWQPLQRAKLYRLVELVGKWSMLDVYVVTMLAALVQLNALASIKPAAGALAFGAVVVLTMFAAMSFDPRLIWDSMENNDA